MWLTIITSTVVLRSHSGASITYWFNFPPKDHAASTRICARWQDETAKGPRMWCRQHGKDLSLRIQSESATNPDAEAGNSEMTAQPELTLTAGREVSM